MSRSADFVYGVNQGVLIAGLECNVEINRGASGRETTALPVGWDGIPGVLDTHVIPMWRYRCREAEAEDQGAEDGEQRPPVMTHNYRQPMGVTVEYEGYIAFYIVTVKSPEY